MAINYKHYQYKLNIVFRCLKIFFWEQQNIMAKEFFEDIGNNYNPEELIIYIIQLTIKQN